MGYSFRAKRICLNIFTITLALSCCQSFDKRFRSRHFGHRHQLLFPIFATLSVFENLWETNNSTTSTTTEASFTKKQVGRVSLTHYILSPEQIQAFHRDGCVTLHDLLTEEELLEIEAVFDKFLDRTIHVPGKDFCDMSKPFDTPFEDWSIVNCMLPTKYYPPLQNNIYEQLTQNIARQLFPSKTMVKDYDQFLNKRANKSDAIFAWHQDMAYWPSSQVLSWKGGLSSNDTSTCTFSLAIDDSTEENGCLRYVVGSGREKLLRNHKPLGSSREDSHALKVELTNDDTVQLAPCPRRGVTIHDEYVVHGSGGNSCPGKQRRTYVLAYRAKEIVDAERNIGFSHSHNDNVNWDTFNNDLLNHVDEKKI
jgi:hypothetical protein